MIRPILLALCSIALAGQTARPLEFEVASVRPIPGPVGFHNTTFQVLPNAFNADYAALRQITGVAYNIQRVRVEGGPDWMDSDLYKIAAKAESPDPTNNADQIREMLRTLLAERFKLVVHRETKQLPVCTLVLGKSGSKLLEVKDDPPGSPSVAPGGWQSGAPRLSFQNMPLGGLVNYLANMLGSPVLDQTRLTGRYNFALEFVPPGIQHVLQGDQAWGLP